MNRSKKISFIVAIMLIIFLIQVIDWEEFGNLMLRLSPASILAGFAIYVALNFFRALRFKALLDRDEIPIKLLFPIALAHNFLVRLLPFKLGELAYPVMLKNRLDVPIEESVSSLGGSRLLELLVIVTVGCVALLIGSDVFPGQQSSMMILAAIFVIAAMAAFYYAGTILRFSMKTLRGILKSTIKKEPAFLDKLEKILEKIALEFDRVSQPRLFLKALFWSLFTYACSFGTNLVILWAVGIQLSPFEMVILISMGMFATAFPFNISGFGMVELSWGVGLAALAAYSMDDATAVGLLLNGFQVLCAAVSGIIGYGIFRFNDKTFLGGGIMKHFARTLITSLLIASFTVAGISLSKGYGLIAIALVFMAMSLMLAMIFLAIIGAFDDIL